MRTLTLYHTCVVYLEHFTRFIDVAVSNGSSDVIVSMFPRRSPSQFRGFPLYSMMVNIPGITIYQTLANTTSGFSLYTTIYFKQSLRITLWIPK